MTSQPDRIRQGGFTLIEMLAVLAVLALGVALVTLRGPAQPRALGIASVADDIAASFRQTRTQAIATGHESFVLVDAEDGRISGGAIGTRAVPKGMTLALFGPFGPVEARQMRIAFGPDGGSTGGAVLLTDGPRRLRIEASWLSGRIVIADARQ